MRKIFRVFTLVSFAVLAINISSIAEEITLTTYYPAPYGVYEELTTTGNTVLARDGGSVGIGTTTPTASFDTDGRIRIRSNTLPTAGVGLELGYYAVGNTGVIMAYDRGAAAYKNIGYYGLNHLFFIEGNEKVRIDNAGNVGIGTPTPSHPLEVNGKVKIVGSVGIGGEPGSGANELKVYGKILTNNSATPGLDGRVWEFDIAEDILAEDCKPGDIVVIDTDNNEKVVKSSVAYDTTVAGIISTDPAFHIGKQDGEGYFPLALAGRVPCKVSMENGAIERGDLLTTSFTPGHAMKATDRDRSFGAILGKALEPFTGGPEGEETGKIVVLVTLQ